MSIDCFSLSSDSRRNVSRFQPNLSTTLMSDPFPAVPAVPIDPNAGSAHRPLNLEQMQRLLIVEAASSGSEDPLTSFQSAFASSTLQPEDNGAISAAAVKKMIMDGRKVSPALRLVKDALCRYQGVPPGAPKRGVKPDPSLERARLARARRLLYPSPELSQADPLPMKESARATSSRSTSAGPSVATSFLTHSRPTTSGPLPRQWQALPKRPLTSPVTSDGLQQVPGSRLTISAGSRNRRSALRGKSGIHSLTLAVSSSQSSIDSGEQKVEGSPKSTSKVAQRMACLAGRLHHKVYRIRATNKGECALAFSCRKRLTLQKLHRQEEKNLAAAAIHSRQLEEWGSPTNSISAASFPSKSRETVLKGSKREDAGNEGSKVFGKSGSLKEVDYVPKIEEVQSQAADSKLGKFTSFKAHELSCDFNLPGGHVTQAWKLFKRYDLNNDDILSPYEFQLLLRHVLRDRFPSAKDVPRELFKEAIDIQHTDLPVTFVDFLTWITRNAFQECLLLNTEQRFMRLVARKFQVHVTDVELVKRHFDHFTQQSGRMEYSQFHKLLALLLNLQDVSSLPESRVKSFWRELAGDHGIVEFTDFIPWYLGCFAGENGSPLVNFYRKIRPISIVEDHPE